MLSYQHAYHAGGWADLVKHAVLSRIMTYFAKKESPFFYFETHAGQGLYDLTDPLFAKTKEAELGIQRLWRNRDRLSAHWLPFLSGCDALNAASADRCIVYPGSPFLAKHLSRPQDRLYYCELHPQAFERLSQTFSSKQNAHFCYFGDGVSQLKAVLPPKERRGVIFIDPAYEVKTEYRTIPLAVKAAVDRFSTGVYCIWYPILEAYDHQRWIRQWQHLGCKGVHFEYFTQNPQSRMKGSGMYVINPTYGLSEEIGLMFKELSRIEEDIKS